MDEEFLSIFQALRETTKCSVEAAVVAASNLFVADSVEALTAAVADRENEELVEVVSDETDHVGALPPEPDAETVTPTTTPA